VQRAVDVPKEVPPFVTATSTFSSMVYPGQGLERTLHQEHVERMNARDFMKVMEVREMSCIYHARCLPGNLVLRDMTVLFCMSETLVGDVPCENSIVGLNPPESNSTCSPFVHDRGQAQWEGGYLARGLLHAPHFLHRQSAGRQQKGLKALMSFLSKGRGSIGAHLQEVR